MIKKSGKMGMEMEIGQLNAQNLSEGYNIVVDDDVFYCLTSNKLRRHFNVTVRGQLLSAAVL